MILKKKKVVENECEPKLGYKMISINDYQIKKNDKHKPFFFLENW